MGRDVNSGKITNKEVWEKRRKRQLYTPPKMIPCTTIYWAIWWTCDFLQLFTTCVLPKIVKKKKMCVCGYTFMPQWNLAGSVGTPPCPSQVVLAVVGSPDHFSPQGCLSALLWFTHKCRKQNRYWLFRWRLSILKKVRFIKTALHFQDYGKKAKQRKGVRAVLCSIMVSH